ncbi:putative secreted protein [Corynebacterium variabile DSM 44702]|uniref:Putative secreted protein n=1 Tax=Corynebacterium variabile (strain DSM 44702 / CIP 107183 / JCM 12073 / NCIMB 30131) TaxID=858619 RepID=G0HC39_CORVD|nr:hypothetical protein [Corynebacterium variabile]AEK35894.1 putative secreted protein [Corynebacterium variabile DSM 44702]
MRRHSLTTLATTAAAVLALAACGNDEPTDTSEVAPMLLAEEDAPAGYTWNSVSEVLTDSGDDLGQQLDAAMAGVTTEPESCAALVPSSDSIIAELYDHQDAVDAVEFLPDDENDPAVIDAIVSTADAGDTADLASGEIDAGDCGDFTRTDSSGTETTFHATVQKASVADTDDTSVITVLSDSATPGEELVTTVVGTVDDVHFRVTAAGVTDIVLLTELAEKQVAQITGTQEGQE